MKVLTIICFSLALLIATADSNTDCSGTSELRDLFGLANSLTTAQTYSDVKYCKSIKSGPVCCTDTQINSFQTLSDNIVANLTKAAIIRDKTSVAAQNAIPALKQNLENLQSSLGQLSTAISSPLLAGFANSSEIQDGLDLIANSTELLNLVSGNVADSYTTYQNLRSTCVVGLMKLQTAAFCLACDPNAAAKGYNEQTGDIAISDRVCTRMQTACSGYIAAGAEQSALIESYYGTGVLQVVVEIIQAAANNDEAGVEKASEGLNNVQVPDSIYETPADTPDGCDTAGSGTCSWICTDLFYEGQVNQEALILAGEADDSSDEDSDDTSSADGGRRLFQTLDGGNRNLDSGDFDPDSDESGVTVTFAADPSGTNAQTNGSENKKSAVQSFGNVFVAMLVVLASLMMI